VAYVVPDRELPLVNIAILVRTGSYLEPAGKEGLADLTGYLLARGAPNQNPRKSSKNAWISRAELNSAIGANQGQREFESAIQGPRRGLGILRETLTAPRFSRTIKSRCASSRCFRP